METKVYRMYGIDTAMNLLRPEATWEIINGYISKWDDPRPCPTMEEIYATMDKIKAFEESIDTIWLPDQYKKLTGQVHNPEAE
jgi:hypothetical protein